MTEIMPIGIVQMCATSDVGANLASKLGLAREAAEAGAKMVFLPEAFARCQDLVRAEVRGQLPSLANRRDFC